MSVDVEYTIIIQELKDGTNFNHSLQDNGKILAKNQRNNRKSIGPWAERVNSVKNTASNLSLIKRFKLETVQP